MSRMMLRSDRKPPLARSPTRLRPRRTHQSSAKGTLTPPGTHLSKHTWEVVEDSAIRPEYQSISCELRALAQMVSQEFHESTGLSDENPIVNASRSPLFERGRFYEEYSARRNERLKRKKNKVGLERRSACDHLGVRVESAKRRGEVKKFESARKTVLSTPVMERSDVPRYSLRSSSVKENMKPPMATSLEKSAGTAARKKGTRRIGRS